MNTCMRRHIPLLLVPFLFAAVLKGQVATGVYSYGTFDNKGFDTINVGNLNVHFAIPVLHKAGRGIPFYYDLTYDSSVWYPVTAGSTAAWTPAQAFGWGANTVITTGYLSYTYRSGTCLQGTVRIPMSMSSNIVYHDPFGGVHPFNGIVETGCTTENTVQVNSTDGYHLQNNQNYLGPVLNGAGTVFQVPVNTGSGAGSATDSNGNEVTIDSNGNFTDTTGKVALSIGGGAPNPLTLTYKDTFGNSQEVKVYYAEYTVQTAFNCSGISEYGPTPAYLVSSISMSDGSAYQFSYEATPGASENVTGRLAHVQLPQGNMIQYAYTGGNNGIECTDGSTLSLSRTLNADSGSATSATTYTRSNQHGTNTSHTEVVDGLNNHLAYDFVETSLEPTPVTAAYYEVNRNIYQGAETGTPVIARQTCYDGASPPCTANTTFQWPISQIDTYEVPDGVAMHGSTAKFSAYGMETEADTYDFGSTSARGGLLRKEVWTYGGSSPYLATEDDVFDGNGTAAGKTTYSYDGGSLTASSGVPQHGAVSGARGNLTGVSQYASASTAYSSSASYEDTGSVLTTTTPSGTTTFSYDPTFVYLTGDQLPTPSSGITIGTGASYDTADTGLPLSFTDPNTQLTKIVSYDSMLRPTETDFPDGGKVTLSYSPRQLGQQVYQSASVFSDSETQYDGYGRPSRAAIANGQSGNSWYQRDTCYDGNGNVAFSSYAYQGMGFNASKVCTGNGDSYTYDVLGRLTSVTRANGESISYTYHGRATQIMDQNGVTRISQSDGLGRPTNVCEISSNSNMPGSGSPVSCGTDIAGTGFTTSYSYLLATGTTTVQQGGQTRTFQTDWLGRPTIVTEPESGTTTYGYAYNGTDLVVTRSRPKANQTNSSVLTTTTTTYDSLGRVISIGYDDGTTPTKTFLYDTSAGTSFSDLAQANLKGRLSLTSVSGAGTAYSYDAMGRPSYLDECFPSGCGTVSYNKQLHYVYDLAGNLVGSTDGAGITTSYTVSPANEILSLTSSLNNGSNPPNLVSNVLNGPNGPIFYNLGNGLSGGYSYDGLGRLNGAWVRQSGNPTSCPSIGKGYRYTSSWKGDRLTNSSDTVLAQTSTYGYDEFDRLTSRTVTTGTAQNFTWGYDRWGNRTSQIVTAGSGPQPQYSFNTANNRITGYSYDAAGNMTNDGYYSYTYDAEGNVTAVNGGSTAQYVYNALNQRVQTVVGSTKTEFVYNVNGRRVSIWNGTSNTQIQGQYYWGSKPVAFYKNGQVHFQHQDWLGTERIRTTYNGVVEGTFTSLPFGDAQTTASGTDLDPHHYAQLDYDSETSTSHAQFRQYNSTEGRWMRPDPNGGSYDFSNPQSFNRYAYASNNPLANSDPAGLTDICSCWFLSADQVYAGDDPSYTLDGLDVPGIVGSGALQSGEGAICPNNNCVQIYVNGNWNSPVLTAEGFQYLSSATGQLAPLGHLWGFQAYASYLGIGNPEVDGPLGNLFQIPLPWGLYNSPNFLISQLVVPGEFTSSFGGPGGLGAVQYQTYQGTRLLQGLLQGTSNSLLGIGKDYACGDSALVNIKNYALEGLGKGAIAGAFEGTGAPGATTVEGAIYGGWVGGIVGTSSGIVASAACGAFGAY